MGKHRLAIRFYSTELKTRLGSAELSSLAPAIDRRPTGVRVAVDYIGTPTSARCSTCWYVHSCTQRRKLAHGRTASILSNHRRYVRATNGVATSLFTFQLCLLKCRVNVYPVGAARKLYALLLEFEPRHLLSFFLFSFCFFNPLFSLAREPRMPR